MRNIRDSRRSLNVIWTSRDDRCHQEWPDLTGLERPEVQELPAIILLLDSFILISTDIQVWITSSIVYSLVREFYCRWSSGISSKLS